jgi:hypothetical protein
MATTYRGYDLKTEDDGRPRHHPFDGLVPGRPPRSSTSEEKAMDHIDSLRRKALAK